MNIVILDNFDSFTFNLLDEFSDENHKIHVWRNSMSADEAEKKLLSLAAPRLLVLSPGPGHPDDAGCMNELIKRMNGKVPIFGVCLGMQAMVSIFGGEVKRAPNIVHGKARMLADSNGVDIRSYTIIYELLDDEQKSLMHYWKSVENSKRIGKENEIANLNIRLSFKRKALTDGENVPVIMDFVPPLVD